MPYTVTKTALPGVVILEPTIFEDARGFFFESFNQREFHSVLDLNVEFIQDNHSRSSRGVIRGLHYQLERPQGKLIRVTHGAVFDVAVDLRRSSPTFGKWLGVELSAANKRQLWVPPGFAHGFLAISEFADCLYKTTEYWYPEHERVLLWCDPTVGVKWPSIVEPRLTNKDAAAKTFAEAEHFN